jgi:hypothetical protein
MNCKPGDLAVIIRSVSGNEGKIVRVLRMSKEKIGLLAPDGFKHGIVWDIDPHLPGWNGLIAKWALDYQLRPIRDNDGEDETLTWAGKPESINA